MTGILRGVAARVKSLGSTISLSLTGNHGVCVRRWRRSKSWRHIGRRRVRVMKKLDKSKVEWIIREKRKGTHNRMIAEQYGISVRWVQKLWRRYKDKDEIEFPIPMGRPKGCAPGRQEHSAILSAASDGTHGAAALERVLKLLRGIHIPHNALHKVLKDAGFAVSQPRKSGRRKWIRYEREHSNSLWHTDYKQLDDGRWFICYEDDASRFVVGYGVFDEATTKNALAVLDQAIRDHGKPAAILTDRGSQFYATESEAKKKGVSEFEKRLVELEIRHILARVKHPQTNGKLERLHGELQRKLHLFEKASASKTTRRGSGDSHVGGPFNAGPERDPVERFMEWYNYRRAHMSLDWDNLETPAKAYARKMPPRGEIVVDGQTGEEYRAE